MCSSTREDDGALIPTNCTKLPQVLNVLKQSKYYQRRAGSDHILILSINHMMLHFLNEDCQSIFEECINCVKFSIDYYTHLLYPELKKLPHLSKNWISVPFPSNYHTIESKATNLPWKQKNESRKYPFCYLGSPEVTAKKQKALRKKLIEFCEKYSKDCYFTQLPSHSSNVDYFHLSNVSSSQIVTLRSKSSKIQSVNLYNDCQFCFTPGGDFPTRKAFFDAYLSGCIPIVFQLESAHFQWPYHWINRANAYNSVLYYSRERFMTQTLENNYKLLMKYSENPNFIQGKLETIAEIGNRLQYSHLPEEIITKKKTFKPIEKDAFEVIIDILRMKVSFD